MVMDRKAVPPGGKKRDLSKTRRSLHRPPEAMAAKLMRANAGPECPQSRKPEL
jgi:hypothetical protein